MATNQPPTSESDSDIERPASGGAKIYQRPKSTNPLGAPTWLLVAIFAILFVVAIFIFFTYI